MKSVFVKKPFQFDVREIPIPPLGPHDVQVRVKACGLCGTDVRQAAIGESFAPFGHEVAGIVEAIGSAVENVRPATTSAWKAARLTASATFRAMARWTWI